VRIRTGWQDRAPAGVVEPERRRIVGIAGDPEPPDVVHPVMARADGQQVRGVRRPAVGPVPDVMEIQTSTGRAPRNLAAVIISTENRATRPIGDRPLRPTDRHRPSGTGEEGIDPPVAGEMPGDRLWQRHTSVGVHRAVELEIQVDPIPVASCRSADRVERPLRELDETVDIGGGARARTRWPVLTSFVLASEHRVSCLVERGLDERAEIGIEIGMEEPPAVVAVPEVHAIRITAGVSGRR
jgi:hypothetical protein